MDSSELLKKVQSLEQQLDELKSHFPRPRGLRRAFSTGKRWVDGVVAYWVLLAVVGGIAVNSYYRVRVFQNIANIGVNNTSSDYYYKVGENFLEHTEFAAAVEAFTKALEINPSNADARHGLMKAQVFHPAAQGAELNLQVVEQKLSQLSDPKIFGPHDYLLLYWKGRLKRKQGGADASATHFEAARSLFKKSFSAEGALPRATPGFRPLWLASDLLDEMAAPGSELALFGESIAINRNFIGSHFELGNSYLNDSDLERAAAKYEDVLMLDGRFAPALSSLGYCRLVLATSANGAEARAERLARARENLDAADAISPRPETELHLGDTYLFDGTQPRHYVSARVSYENALASLARLSADDAASAPLDLYFVFLPRGAADANNRNAAREVSRHEDLKALILYSLSMTDALRNDARAAEARFCEASALPRSKYYPGFVKNKIRAVLALLNPEPSPRAWLNGKLADFRCVPAAAPTPTPAPTPSPSPT